MLKTRLLDETYRRAVLDGSYERKNNPWLNLANSYDWVGSLVKHKLIPEESLLDVYAGRVDQAWSIVEAIVPLVRELANGAPHIKTERIPKECHAFELTWRGQNFPNDCCSRALCLQNLVDEGDYDRTFAHGGCDTLDAPAPHVADRKYPR
jgi:hypothetical protein